jgi:hypothetical protein
MCFRIQIQWHFETSDWRIDTDCKALTNGLRFRKSSVVELILQWKQPKQQQKNIHQIKTKEKPRKWL